MQVCQWNKLSNCVGKVRNQYQLIMYKFLLDDKNTICDVHLYFIGFICVRAIDTITGAPRPILSILHRKTTAKVGKTNKNVSPNES
jgi:hypothetical protein